MADRSQPSNDPLYALALRLRGGDESVLPEILEALRPAMTGSLRSRFGSLLSTHDVEEVLSKALFQLWQSRDRYDPKRAPLALWFFLAVRSAAIDLLRKRARSVTTVNSPAEWAVTARADPRTDEADRPSPDLLRLRVLLDQLPEPDRRILLAFAEKGDGGAWASELAEELAMTANAVRVRKSRLLDWLRQKMSEDAHT
jgi:RNA polymerase sigma factor (sigma-70 family)